MVIGKWRLVIGIDNGVTSGFADFDFVHADGAKILRGKVRGAAHVGSMFRRCRNAWDAQPVHKSGEMRGVVGAGVVESRIQHWGRIHHRVFMKGFHPEG